MSIRLSRRNLEASLKTEKLECLSCKGTNFIIIGVRIKGNTITREIRCLTCRTEDFDMIKIEPPREVSFEIPAPKIEVLVDGRRIGDIEQNTHTKYWHFRPLGTTANTKGYSTLLLCQDRVKDEEGDL